jgi:ribonucleoside-diphosphate reductase alpha chain
MQVVKRNGRVESMDFDKIDKVLNWSCEGIDGVHKTQVLMKTQTGLFDGIKTKDIHETLIRAAYNLVGVNPNYTYVASRLAFYMLYKDLFNGFEKPKLRDHYNKYLDLAYTETLKDTYTDEEWEYLNSKIAHDRDFKIPYPGFKQWQTKYLAQNRKTNQVYETPQIALMLLSMKIFEISKIDRLRKVADYYDAISNFKINLSTPIMAGVRTKHTQFSSCILIDAGDSMKSILAANTAIGLHIANRAGVGINHGRLRGIDSPIRNGDAVHTGKIPFAKMVESTVKSCSQGGIRGGAATMHYTIWDSEIMNLLVLKNNQGTEDNRVRKIDYSIQISRIFYERFLKNGDITLFSTSDVPGLYEAFGDNEKFDALYLYYEKQDIPKKVIKARDAFNVLASERFETGRIYISNVDNVNTHSSFFELVRQSNLCQEVTLPTKPFEHEFDESGEIALCILSAIVAGYITLDEIKPLMYLIVESLDNLIDIQSYLMVQSEKMKKRRSLGIGINNLAHYFAQNHCAYGSTKSKELLNEFAEMMTYYGIEASINLAKERGTCEWYNDTKYSKGILPIDTRNTKIDEVVPHVQKMDWDSLRELLKLYGIRNSTLFAQMPCESSSIPSGSTNGIEPARQLMTAKKNKTSGVMRTFVPDIQTLGHHYTLAFDVSNKDMNILTCILQKYFDQAISVNHYYRKKKGETGVSVTEILTDILTFYRYGGKNLYYANTDDESTDEFDFSEDDGCESGACAL